MLARDKIANPSDIAPQSGLLGRLSSKRQTAECPVELLLNLLQCVKIAPMSFELSSPDVLETIDPGLLALLNAPNVRLPDGVPYSHIQTPLRPLYDELLRVAGVEVTPELEFLGRSSDVFPNRSQISRGWHYDRIIGSAVADVIPTQILVGDAEVVADFWKSEAGKGVRIPMEGFNEQQIMERLRDSVRYISDDDLEKNTVFESGPQNRLRLLP